MLTIRFNQAWEGSSSKKAKKHGCEPTYRHFVIMSAIISNTFKNINVLTGNLKKNLLPVCYTHIKWRSKKIQELLRTISIMNCMCQFFSAYRMNVDNHF